jgi:hypothetical protein
VGYPKGRKTRFWLRARLYQTGLVTRRVPTKGFRDASYIASPLPKLLGAKNDPESDFRGPRNGLVHSILSLVWVRPPRHRGVESSRAVAAGPTPGIKCSRMTPNPRLQSKSRPLFRSRPNPHQKVFARWPWGLTPQGSYKSVRARLRHTARQVTGSLQDGTPSGPPARVGAGNAPASG